MQITTMRTPNQIRKIQAATAIAMSVMTFSALAANPSEKDKQFLTSYEKIHAALAADDLASAKSAAKDIGDAGSDISKANSLADARTAFEKLSEKAKSLIVGQSGFYVIHCPMLKKDWVQTTDKIANPYGGKDMTTCGEIKK